MYVQVMYCLTCVGTRIDDDAVPSFTHPFGMSNVRHGREQLSKH